jgi:hypothetical protein
LAKEAKKPIPAVNIMKILGGVRSSLCRAKLTRRDPLRNMPVKAARHKNIPMIRTVVQLIGVGRLQNSGSSGDKPTPIDELSNDSIAIKYKLNCLCSSFPFICALMAECYFNPLQEIQILFE